MINYDSILSAFDGKPTLLQWLKLVKKALDESVLKDITLKQDGASVVFTFNFEDGTSISTPAVTLPKGDTGAKGDKGDTGPAGPKGDKGDIGKFYRHNIYMIGGNGEIYFTLYTSQESAYTSVNPVFAILGNTPYQFVYYNGADGNGIGVVMSILDNKSFKIKLYKISSTSVTTTDTLLQTPTTISDNVIEV